MITKSFSEYLKQLSEYAAKLDSGTVTDDDYGKFQEIGSDIIRDANLNKIEHEERKALDSVYFYLKPQFRRLLYLDRLDGVYTMKHWKADRTFNAQTGQEVSEDVYNAMLNCMPPKSLPRDFATSQSTPVGAGFLMGEPHSSSLRGELYLAFGTKTQKGKAHYYYLGLCPER